MRSRFLLYLLIFAGLLHLASKAQAQNPADSTDPLQVLTFHDSSNGAVCIPMKAVDNDSDLQKYGGGCCASPGRRGCISSASTPTYPVCFNFDSALLNDPYGSGSVCSLSPVVTDPAIPTLGQNGQDSTFYVSSDIHFFRRTFELTDQLNHVQVIKGFNATNPMWPTGTGIPANTPIQAPLAVVIDGDITTYGAADNLGAYRMSWERGTLPDSIQYPVLFGIGNHETVSDETPKNAQRMFNYLQTRMANTHMDPGSGNYSWDWNGVHYVQQNVWAGDQTSLYVHPSDGLAWLANDLKTYVGNTTKPVVLFQHYRFSDVTNTATISPSQDDFWPIDQNAIDSTGKLTGQGYQTWYNIVKNYNVIGMFGGHDHCLGVSSSILAKLPQSGGTYPGIAGYGLPIDNFDDGSGGDTHGTVAQDPGGEEAGIGNPCAPTQVDGQSIAQTAVASFLVTHISKRYMDVAAVSWNNTAPAPYFDNAEGMPTGSSTCRKRINSQFIAAPADFQVKETQGGYRVVSATGTPVDVPVALRFGSHSGATNFNFVDNCGDPQETGSNNVYYLVNGEQNLLPGLSYFVPTTGTGGASVAPAAVLLTPLSGVSVPFLPTSQNPSADPILDTFVVYGPPGESFTQSVTYNGRDPELLTVRPLSTAFNMFGEVNFEVHYKLGAAWPLFSRGSSADIQITTGGTGIVQNVHINAALPRF